MARPAAIVFTCALAAPVAAIASAQQAAEPTEEVLLGARSAIRAPDAAAETVHVAAGTRLYALPDRRSALIDVAAIDAPLAVAERVAGWVMVRIGGQGAWAAVADGRAGPDVEAPPAMRYLEAIRRPLAPSADRLARARALLGQVDGRPAGPFTLYTDVAAQDTVAILRGLLADLPAIYAERYGVAPLAGDRFAMVVFADETTYRAFESDNRELRELRAGGHTAGNVAAIWAGGRALSELGPILLHETVHLLNRSAFRLALPAWLEEGLAVDLSYARLDDEGRLDPERLGGVDRRTARFEADGSLAIHSELWGAPAALRRLAAAARSGEWLPLAELMSLGQRQMMRIDGRPLRYAQSGFLVRYLLDGAGEGERRALHGTLRQTAEGAAGAEALTALLGRDVDDLSRGFEDWLVTRERRLRSRR